MNESEAAKKAAAEAAKLLSQPALPSQWSEEMVFNMTLTILIFGAFVVSLLVFVMRKSEAKEAPFELIQVVAVPLVICAMLIMVVAGYSDKQIAAPLGLLGAIAGYLLGSRTASPMQQPGPPAPPEDPKP